MTGFVLGGGRGGATTATSVKAGAEGSQVSEVKVSTLLVEIDLSSDVTLSVCEAIDSLSRFSVCWICDVIAI